MCMRTIKCLGALLLGALSAVPVMAQQTYEEMEQLTVNEQVTTVITASEPVRFVLQNPSVSLTSVRTKLSATSPSTTPFD